MVETQIIEGLKSLGCPFLDQIPSLDAILIPGKLRYQLFEWLFLQYDCNLPDPSKDGTASQEEKLSCWASLVGLSGSPVREGIINGDDERRFDLQMIKQLIELASLSKQTQQRGTDLDGDLARDIQFMRRIAPNSKKVFSAHCDLLPADMQIAVDNINKIEVLRHCTFLRGCITDLQSKIATVQEKGVENTPSLTEEDLINLQRTVLGFQGAAKQFSRIYETEFKALVDSSKRGHSEESSQLADVIKEVIKMYNNVAKVLQDLNVVKSSLESISRIGSKHHHTRAGERLYSDEKLDSIEEIKLVLREAIKRCQEGKATTC